MKDTIIIILAGLIACILAGIMIIASLNHDCTVIAREQGAHGDARINYNYEINCYATFDHGATYELIEDE